MIRKLAWLFVVLASVAFMLSLCSDQAFAAPPKAKQPPAIASSCPAAVLACQSCRQAGQVYVSGKSAGPVRRVLRAAAHVRPLKIAAAPIRLLRRHR